MISPGKRKGIFRTKVFHAELVKVAVHAGEEVRLPVKSIAGSKVSVTVTFEAVYQAHDKVVFCIFIAYDTVSPLVIVHTFVVCL